jgi:hypothetical protein
MASRLRGHSGASSAAVLNPVAQSGAAEKRGSVELPSRMSSSNNPGVAADDYINTCLLADSAAVEACEAKVAALVKFQGFHRLREILGPSHDEHGNEIGVGGYRERNPGGGGGGGAGGAHDSKDSGLPPGSLGLPSNDYIAACLHTPAGACQITADNLGTNAIVAGLLLTVSLSYAVSPPDVIVGLPNGDASKTAFVLLMNISAGFSFLLIIFAAQFAVAASRAVRDSDKMRVLLHLDSWLPLDPNSVGVVSMYGTVITLVAGMVVASHEQYGTATTIASAAIFLVLVVLGIKVGSSFVFAGHISFYWKEVGHKNKTDPVDLHALGELMALKVKIGENLFADYKARHHLD